MSGSAGLSAAKRRRAEQTLPQQPQQQPIRQSVKETQQQTKPTPRILTPMSILEDHELRLRYIESCIKDGVPAPENEDKDKKDGTSTYSTKKDVSNTINDTYKNELTVILNRIGELENTNTVLRKKIIVLETDLCSVSAKHSNLQTFAMETNTSLLKHKDTFEPDVVNRLINILLDKPVINTRITAAMPSSESETVAVETEAEPSTITNDEQDGEECENKVIDTVVPEGDTDGHTEALHADLSLQGNFPIDFSAKN
jgi:hypothetical protein